MLANHVKDNAGFVTGAPFKAAHSRTQTTGKRQWRLGKVDGATVGRRGVDHQVNLFGLYLEDVQPGKAQLAGRGLGAEPILGRISDLHRNTETEIGLLQGKADISHPGEEVDVFFGKSHQCHCRPGAIVKINAEELLRKLDRNVDINEVISLEAQGAINRETQLGAIAEVEVGIANTRLDIVTQAEDQVEVRAACGQRVGADAKAHVAGDADDTEKVSLQALCFKEHLSAGAGDETLLKGVTQFTQRNDPVCCDIGIVLAVAEGH